MTSDTRMNDILDAFDLSESDKGFITGQATAEGKDVYNYIRDIVLDKLEEQQDYASYLEITNRPDYRKDTVSHEELKAELGL
ncbi:DUF6290 family protein [Enterococcus olivae]